MRPPADCDRIFGVTIPSPVGERGTELRPSDPTALVVRIERLAGLPTAGFDLLQAESEEAGIGHRLVAEIIAAARGPFDSLRLRSASREASRLYEGLGFRPCSDVPDCTHVMTLPRP